jgi:hypothetical protein
MLLVAFTIPLLLMSVVDLAGCDNKVGQTAVEDAAEVNDIASPPLNMKDASDAETLVDTMLPFMATENVAYALMDDPQMKILFAFDTLDLWYDAIGKKCAPLQELLRREDAIITLKALCEEWSADGTLDGDTITLQDEARNVRYLHAVAVLDHLERSPK